WRRPLQDDKLLAEKCRFGLASRMRSEPSDEQSAEQLQEVKHRKARIAHRGICASPDTIFGSHRCHSGYDRFAGVKKRERNSCSPNTRPISLNEKNGISPIKKIMII